MFRVVLVKYHQYKSYLSELILKWWKTFRIYVLPETKQVVRSYVLQRTFNPHWFVLLAKRLNMSEELITKLARVVTRVLAQSERSVGWL